MKQKEIKTTAGALDSLTKAIGGATTHGATIGLKQYDAASLTARKGYVVTAESTLDAARAELKTRQSALADAALSAIAFLTLARDVMKPRFGTSYSTAWDELGFVGSLKVPRTYSDVKFKLQKLVVFLTGNPAAANVDLDVTVAHAQALLDDIITKENAVTAQETVLGNAVQARKATVKMAAQTITGLVSELKGLLQPLDMMYLSFRPQSARCEVHRRCSDKCFGRSRRIERCHGEVVGSCACRTLSCVDQGQRC